MCKFLTDIKTAFPEELRSRRFLWGIVVVLILCRLSGGLAAWWSELLGEELTVLLGFLQRDALLSWIVLAITIYIGGRFAYTDLRRLRISPNIVLLTICCICFVCAWPGTWLRCMAFGLTLSFKWVLLCFLFASLLVEIYKFVKSYVKRFHQARQCHAKSEAEGLVAGLPVNAPEYFDDGRKQFASSLATLITKTNFREEPLTLGITGGWGTGKTLVLDELKLRVQKAGMDVIEFFPWQSTNPANLIEDFFKTLSASLHRRSRILGNALENYADKLIALDIDKRLNSIAKIGRVISGTYISINSAREKIQQDLLALRCSVVVFIDDIDRLDADELFETLRLVRNTAHFRNMAYVMAYDREYVANMLRRKGIEGAERYLEKIFTFNMPLPAYENYTSAAIILRQMRRKYAKGSEEDKRWVNLLTLYYPKRPHFLLNSFIHNHRQAVSLSTFLIARYEILKTMMPKFSSDICINEWYYLQLLSFFYPAVYETLENNTEKLLDLRQSVFQEPHYVISDDKFKEYDKVNDGALILLNLLFGHRPDKDKEQSLLYERNFYNYFALRVLRNEVSESDFMTMLTDESIDINETLLAWFSRRPSVKGAVSSLFARHSLTTQTEITAARMIKAMLLWWTITSDSKVLEALQELTVTSHNEKAFNSAEKSYRETIADLIENSDAEWSVLCDAVIAQSYRPDDPSEPEEDQATRFLSIEDSKKFIGEIVHRAFSCGDIYYVDDLSKPHSVVANILKHSYTETHVEAGFLIVDNFAVEPLIDGWRELIGYSPDAKGHDLVGLQKEMGYDEIYDPDAQEYLSEKIEKTIQETFGSAKNLKTIIEEFYDVSKKEKEDTIKVLGL